MTKEKWRDEWPPFRLMLIDETARCLADQQHTATGGERSGWKTLTTVEQKNLTANIAGIFLAMDQAIQNLDDRSEIL